jgi:two-component system, sensor histidine kinase PdtaS
LVALSVWSGRRSTVARRPAPTGGPRRTRRATVRTGRLVVASGATFALVLAALCALFALAAYRTLLDHAERDTRGLAAVLHQHALRSFQVSGLILDQVAGLVEARGTAGLPSDPDAHQRLRTLAERMPGEEANITVVDPAGIGVLRSNQHPPAPADLGDREWFKAHAERGAERFVGRALIGRTTRRPAFTYSRAVRGPGGELLAVVVMGLPSRSAIGAEAVARHGRDFSLSVYRTDGYLVARNPFSPELVDKVFPLSPEMLATPEGTSYRTRPTDGAYVVTSHKAIPDLGLVVAASIPVRTVLRPLVRGALVGLPVLGLTLAGVLLLTRAALRSLARTDGLLRENGRANAELRRLLEDNRTLFDEVHHRVKNNLQVIAGLLRQQAGRSPPEVASALADATTRVHSIALVHEMIYGGDHPSHVDLATYLERLAASVAGPLGSARTAGEVRLELDLEPVAAGLSQAVPLALIAAEVLTNCYKHAFDGRPGVVRIVLGSRGQGHRLVVADDGRGMPEGARGNLGMSLVRGLTGQLGGRSGFESRGEGTLFWLEWPREGAAG